MRLRTVEDFWRQWLVILGFMHPEIPSAYESGWTGQLPPDVEPIEPFKAKPAKKRRKVA